MPSLNKYFSQERFSPEDHPSLNVHGLSAFIRSQAPMFGKAGDAGFTRRGKKFFVGKASAAIAAPTETAAVITFTVNATGGLATVGAIGTAGAGYNVGEKVPVKKTAGDTDGGSGWITVTTVNATGGITAATVATAGQGYTAGALTLDKPAMAWTLCGIVDANAGTIGAGTTHKSYAPTDIGEYAVVFEV